MTNGITFRRINGRLVPLRINVPGHNVLDRQQRQKKAAIGAGEVAGGLAIAGATGHGVAQAAKKAAQAVENSRRDYKFGKQAITQFTHGQMSLHDAVNISNARHVVTKAVARRGLARNVFRARNTALLAGAAIGAGLVGGGLAKINEARTGKKNTTAKELEIGAGGLAAAAATYGFYYRGLGIKNAAKLVKNVVARYRGQPRPEQLAFKTRHGKTLI